MNIREELAHAKPHGPKFSVRLDPANPSEAERISRFGAGERTVLPER